MLNLVQFIFFFLMMSGDLLDPQPSVSQVQTQESSVPSVFSQWGIGEQNISLPLPLIISINLKEREVLEQKQEELAFLLEKSIARQTGVPSTWEKHLESVGRFFSFFSLIGSEDSNFFNPKSVKPLNLLDIKLLADILFNHDPDFLWAQWPNDYFFSLICPSNELNCYNDPEEICLRSCCCEVSDFSCYSNFTDEKIKSSIELRLQIVRDYFTNQPLGSSSSRVLFLYCETPCCHVVHQVVALVTIRIPNGAFRVYYLDSSDRRGFDFLEDLIYETFQTTINYPCYNQQPEGSSSIFSGLLALVNAQTLVDCFKTDSSVSDLENVNLFRFNNSLDFSDPLNKLHLETFIRRITFRLFWEKFLFHLNCFATLFSRERERALVDQTGTQLIERVFEGYQTQFDQFISLVNKEGEKFSIIKSGEFYSLWSNSKRILSQFVSNHNWNFPDLIIRLRTKLIFLEQGDYSSILTPSFYPIPLTEELSSSNQISMGTPRVVANTAQEGCHVLTEEINFFPLIKRFLISEIRNPICLERTPLSSLFIPPTVTLNTIIRQWNSNDNSPSLFHRSFSSTRMISSEESLIIAELICGFSSEDISFDELKDCFFYKTCSRSKKIFPGTKRRQGCDHHREYITGNTSPVLVAECRSCFLSSDSKAYFSKIKQLLCDYFQDQTFLKDKKPFVCFGGCETSCCQAIHQSWSLVIVPSKSTSSYRAFYYNPLVENSPSQKYFFEAVREIFQVNLVSFTKPQQPTHSLDFSGVLSICGAKMIIAAANKNFSDFKIDTFLSNPSPLYLLRNDSKSQKAFKDLLVIYSLKRLFSGLVKNIECFRSELENLLSRDTTETPHTTLMKRGCLCLDAFITEIKPLIIRIFPSTHLLNIPSNPNEPGILSLIQTYFDFFLKINTF